MIEFVSQHCTLWTLIETMQGGDLQHAVKSPALKWYKNGAWIALDIINGIRFLHTHNVRLSQNLIMFGLQATARVQFAQSQPWP